MSDSEPACSPDEAYRRFGPALVRKAERILGNRDDALDIVHGLFVDAVGGRVRPLELPYLYRAVTNRCLNHLRDAGNRERILSAKSDAPFAAGARTPLGDHLVGVDLITRLMKVIDRRSQEILVYHFVDDMTQDEIASLIGVSRRAVVKRLGKIRDRARRLEAQQTDREVAP